uniref:Uncharacterized protein n=1 Tax=Nelumbo nucifera TaxID=4432 RepID=A0A822XND2_NELNU|nr:TPA_asm: hypothetical protein HUJ06_021718 [Nelumbo nucifera]
MDCAFVKENSEIDERFAKSKSITTSLGQGKLSPVINII